MIPPEDSATMAAVQKRSWQKRTNEGDGTYVIASLFTRSIKDEHVAKEAITKPVTARSSKLSVASTTGLDSSEFRLCWSSPLVSFEVMRTEDSSRVCSSDT